jgi:hydroxypyruvate isomerase
MPVKQSVVVPITKPDKMPMEDFLREVKAIGYPAVEIWGRDADFGAFAELTRRLGLRIASMVGGGGMGDDGLSRAKNHAKVEADLRASIDVAVKSDIPGIIVLAGGRNVGESDIDTLCVCAKGLRGIARYAEEKKVNLNVELLNSRVDHPHYVCDHTDWGIALCEMVNSPRVKVLYDIYHMQIMEGDVIRNLGKAGRWVGHFHTAGVPGRYDLDDQQELNYRGICLAIAASGYDLYVGHEFKPRGDALAALRSAFKICDVP